MEYFHFLPLRPVSFQQSLPTITKWTWFWLDGRCKTVGFDKNVCAGPLWSRTPVKMTYFPEIQLGPGGVIAWAVTVRGWGVFACGIHDRDGGDFNTLTQEAHHPTPPQPPPPHISQYSAFTTEPHRFGLCGHFKHEITCRAVYERLWMWTENIWWKERSCIN